MADNDFQQNCSICNKELIDKYDVVEIGQKGADGINAASVWRGDTIVVVPGYKVHTSCRKKYINKEDIELQLKRKHDGESKAITRSTRVNDGPFNNKTDCFFCGCCAVEENFGHSYVITKTFTKKILQCCDSRCDEWSFKVKGRIEYYNGDLYTAGCVYHHVCSSNFRSGKDIPQYFNHDPEIKRRKSGRPKNVDQEQAFCKMCIYFETNDEEQFSISDLRCKMKDCLLEADSVAYGNQYLKQQLRERYGSCINIAEGDGLNDIVTMQEKSSHILRSYYNTTGNDEASQKKAIIEAAARFIKSDIKAKVHSNIENYPTTDDINVQSALNFIPESLRFLLETMFAGKDNHQKVAGIGQSIIQAVRPRALVAPLQLSLSVQMHHLFKSRFLIETLNKLGFCSSYSEVQRFEKNAANVVAPNMLGNCTEIKDTALLLAADNVDHNILTLDGKGTFHGMGIVAAITPGQKTVYNIPRRQSAELNIAELSKVPIFVYAPENNRSIQQNIKFTELPIFPECTKKIDILWELSFKFKSAPMGWHGLMHTIYKGNEHPGKSSVRYLPIIDMYSGDKSCILSTLKFLCDLSFKYHLEPVITFDQPLYWKAVEIIANSPQNSELKTIVLMLGGFHTFMNYLGAVGKLMDGSGLSTILEEVYGTNTVQHMITGKAVQRAFRGHILVSKCIDRMVISEMANQNPEFEMLLEEAEGMYDYAQSSRIDWEDLLASEAISKIQEVVEKKKSDLKNRSDTCKLWLGYQSMIKIAMSLTFADRTGSWSKHLQAVSDCIPIFAAAGHFNYLKSAHFYLQEMSRLHLTHPEVYRKFEKGLHVVRRSDQYWAGLSSDLVIEQTLMRSLKSSGGLTRGSGLSEEQRALWTLSSPITAEYNIAMQELTSVSFITSEQHKDLSNSRKKRDGIDLEKMYSKLVLHSPFTEDPTLRNIVNGVVAGKSVNVHEYEKVGNEVVKKMIGQKIFSMKFSQKDKAITLGDKSAIKIGDSRTIDSSLLFQRFMVVAQNGELSLEEVMSYELSSYPPALFESTDVLRVADKPQLAHAISEYAPAGILDTVPESEHIVLDGGSLIHRVPWKSGQTFAEIAETYAKFTIRHYGSGTTVVFDSYPVGPSLKDSTHLRRGQNIHPEVSFTPDTEFSGKRDVFLSVSANKQRLIELVSKELKRLQCEVINAPGDADVNIALAAVTASLSRRTTLVGEDTDLLVLLLYYANSKSKSLYFRSDINKPNDKRKVYDIKCIKEILGTNMCLSLLFIHSITGCDTTSRLYGIGKKSVFQKFLKGDLTLQSCIEVFTTPNQTTERIDDLGCKAMSILYGGTCNDSMAKLRYNLFSKKVVSASSFVKPELLPPTECASKLHCRRVYYQILVWMGKENEADPLNWGWKIQNNRLYPMMTTKSAAPESLLKVIHCNCSTSCRTLRCSCRKYGLPCTTVCGPCQFEECDNVQNSSLMELYEDEDG